MRDRREARRRGPPVDPCYRKRRRSQQNADGDVRARPGLSPRDRRLITVAALVALNRTDQLRTHPGRALENGVTQEELVEAITHLAFYAGWPCAVGALREASRG